MIEYAAAKSTTPKISVLLATLNGARYIEAFLDSLIAQEKVIVDLYVSDDGSTDSTLETIRNKSREFNSVHFLDGPRNGPASNFFSLLETAKGQFFAFADQDDIWLPHHLANSITRLKSFPDDPTLTFAQTKSFGVENNVRTVWPNIEKVTLHNLVFENLARGCTIVFNEKLRQLFKSYKPENSIMHDWWLVLLAQTCGRVVFGNQVEVYYRLHEDNFIGAQKSIIRRIKSLFSSQEDGFNIMITQVYELYLQYSKEMNDESKKSLCNLFQILQTRSLLRRTGYLLKGERFRLKLLEEFYVRMRIACCRKPV